MTSRAGQTRSELPRSRRESSSRPRAWLFHVFSRDTPALPTTAACPLDELDEVAIGRGGVDAERVFADAGRRVRLGFPDQWMSVRHARIERRIGGFWLLDDGSKNGLLLNGERTDSALLSDGDWIEIGHTSLRYRCGALPPGRSSAPRPEGVALVTALPDLEERARRLADIARSTVSVVLRGDSGTGKEVMARAVHRLSGRPGELVAVNCGALPATLLESELFGYRKGAFSNAVEDRPGLCAPPTAGRCFSTRSATCRRPRKRRSCACCRSAR